MTSLPTPVTPITRRTLLRLSALSLVAAFVAPRRVQAAGAHGATRARHPEPRPGITAEKVLPDEKIPERYRDAYQAAREIPQVLDGIFCHCHCEEVKGLRSLLSCFESEMPQSCGICLGEARLAKRMHARGRSLDEIRKAVDERFGGGH